MILGNISRRRVSLEKAEELALFRIHDKPSTEAITAFRSGSCRAGLELLAATKPEPRDYAEQLLGVYRRPS